MVDTILYGADDTWSGRTNDVKRSLYHGKLKAVEALRSVVKYDLKQG